MLIVERFSQRCFCVNSGEQDRVVLSKGARNHNILECKNLDFGDWC